MTRKHNDQPVNNQPDATAQRLAQDAISGEITAQDFEKEVEAASDAEVAAALTLDHATDLSVPQARANVKENAENEEFLDEIEAGD